MTTVKPLRKLPATLIPGDGIGPEIVKSAVDILEALGRLAPRRSRYNFFYHSGTQVAGIGLRHCFLSKSNQCRQTRSLTCRCESPRFNPSEICSKFRPP